MTVLFIQVLIIGVMIKGKTRELPPGIDGSLILTEGALVTESFLRPGAVVRHSEGIGEAIRSSEASLRSLKSSWYSWCDRNHRSKSTGHSSLGDSLITDLQYAQNNENAAPVTTGV
jgi:hypothetical protein